MANVAEQPEAAVVQDRRPGTFPADWLFGIAATVLTVSVLGLAGAIWDTRTYLTEQNADIRDDVADLRKRMDRMETHLEVIAERLADRPASEWSSQRDPTSPLVWGHGGEAFWPAVFVRKRKT